MIAMDNVLEKKYQTLQDEFKQFTYLISHDLGGPLRQIKGLSDILLRKMKDKTTEDEEKVFHLLKESVLKSEKRLEAILKLSRLDREVINFEKICCDELLKEVFKTYGTDLREDQFIIHNAELPIIISNRHYLMELFKHIIENCLKFKSSKRELIIEIKLYKEKGCWNFLIANNGIEINNNNCHRYFDLFYQENNTDGEGVGLAICKKIISTLEGEIYFHKNISQTVLQFILPEQNQV